MPAKTPQPEPAEETYRPQTVEEHRIENFEEMGFTSKEAASLAKGRDKHGVLVRYDVVKKALEEGCTPRLAVRIFGDE